MKSVNGISSLDLIIVVLALKNIRGPLSEQAKRNITNGAKLRSGKGKCTKCGKLNFKRDQNGRGTECGCSQKWYQEHNSTFEMKKVSVKNLGQYCLACFNI